MRESVARLGFAREHASTAPMHEDAAMHGAGR